MARLITRIADLCRHRAAEQRFLRRFSMMRLDGEPEDCGPGWYESSRALGTGLLVREGEPGDTLLAEWAEACRPALPVPPPLPVDAPTP